MALSEQLDQQRHAGQLPPPGQVVQESRQKGTGEIGIWGPHAFQNLFRRVSTQDIACRTRNADLDFILGVGQERGQLRERLYPPELAERLCRVPPDHRVRIPGPREHLAPALRVPHPRDVPARRGAK